MVGKQILTPTLDVFLSYNLSSNNVNVNQNINISSSPSASACASKCASASAGTCAVVKLKVEGYFYKTKKRFLGIFENLTNVFVWG